MNTPNTGLNYAGFCIADKIDLTAYKHQFPDMLVMATSKELYYQFSTTKYLYLLSYGVVVFSDMGVAEIASQIEKIKPFTSNTKQSLKEDEFKVKVSEESNMIEMTFDALSLGRFDHAVNKMIMMHLAQSVALDFYNGMSQSLLSELKEYTQYMEIHGKVKLSHKKAMKFIGKSLNAKNGIAENLYILDSPETAWEDEYLDRLHTILAKHFELVQRYREIDSTLKIIEDNLEVYISYNNHRESSRLEWIIIILIIIEVIDTFASKF
ncbi:MAG: hypothetical protein CMP48_24760 [Rickettsiales bacterium]|nr:hypothetical protein [Rickettsiales bacterium]